MTANYKITSIYYTKPRLLRGADGEALPTRMGVVVTVGVACDYDGVGAKKVTKIEYKQDEGQFYVYFTGSCLKTIPIQADTEVCYNIIKEDEG